MPTITKIKNDNLEVDQQLELRNQFSNDKKSRFKS